MIDKLIAFAKTTPYFNLEGYMNRDWLVPYNGNFGIRIHQILKDDDDRALHDHPWPNTSIVLKGGYWEIMPENESQDPSLDHVLYSKAWREAGDIIERQANTRHRIVIPKGQTATSMFIMGKLEQDWGFYTPTGKVYWREYLDDWTTETTTDKPK